MTNRLAQLEILALADAGVLVDSGSLLGGPLTAREQQLIRHTTALIHGVYMHMADRNVDLAERLRLCEERHPADGDGGMSVVA